ncbi:RHS repeat-associated protein [Kribbella voronezhensis]|uniref:RHS repeat-associated protein n=1 Tax=Kribbella voronezhensis TaxID=2512212 RepID=A0A4R7THQ2_9ACTN|nr:polymorphic toxin-type HINT domain-containing protein [Kribbella voronezhensis]TDU91872.1 RHS repeat-associated protein [Kribbella voronezhensis]
MRRFRSILVTLIGISLVAGVASYVPEAEAKAYSRPAPATQQDESVVGHDLQVPPTDRPDPTAVAAQKETPRPIWPGASDATVTLPTPAKALAATPTPVSLQRVGDSPVSVSPAPADGKAKSSDAPSSVRVEVFDQQRTQELGVKGLALRLARTDGVASPGRLRVKVDYSSFRYAYGADWGSRLRLVQLQCSSEKTCERSTVVPNGANDGKAGTYTADVAVAEGVSAFALSAAPSGPYGSYAASTLAAASTWNVGKQTGDFTWSYPFRMPPGTAGPRPELSIGYSSGSVDGQTASTNNQPSWLGQGQSLEAGFVERKYVSCADDMGAGANNTTKTGDQCWKSNNATLSLGSHSSELLWDATQETWKLRKDDGSRIEHLTGAVNGDGGEDIAAGKGDGKGEYWRLTTADGTQYYFGLNPPAYATTPTNSVDTVPVFGNNSGEPCYKGGTAFATSYCQQAWRWNVDRVVDRSGNVMTYRYVKETNNYGRNNNTAVSTYDRASYLSSIEYGEKLGADTGVPPARVIFGVTERCLPSGTLTCAPAQLTAATATSWPDVPFDQICTSASTCPNQTSPAFFTRKRLYTLYTQVLTPDGTARTVDSWAFTQTFPDPGDSTAPALWLNSIQHTGMVGGQSTDPLVSFTKIAKPNRVAGFLAGGFPMNKYRVSSVKTESGAQISVNYSGAECTYTAVKDADPATNTRRCFPAYWTIEGGSSPTLHWFHKYVATQLVEDDLVTDAPDKVTTYTYSGDAAWHYDDNDLTQPKYRTWGDWRGYGTVYEQVGPVGLQTSTSTLYFRGMHGDRASASGGTKTVNVVDSAKTSYADFERLNGYVREEITYNGAGGVEVTGTINTPWLKQTATGDGHAATLLNTSFTRIRTRLADGSYRVAGVDTDFDTFGMPTAISDIGDVLKGDDDRCTRLTYVRNLDAGVGITDTVSREEKVAVSCDLTPNRPAQVISDERTYYDKHTDLAAKPTAGLVTKVETMTGWNGAAVYEQRTRMAYDTLGRTVETYDGLDRLTSSVEFVPATGGPVTQTKTTDAAGNVSVSTLEPAWGSPTVEVDPNGKRTDLAYDASGRLTGVWLADRPKSAGGIASVSFSYLLSNTAGQPNVVTTQELKPNGAYKTTQTLLDGLLRQRQVQTPGANGTGRLITDTKYGSRGVVANEGGPYYEATTAPTNKVYDVLEQNLPAQTVYTVDGVNRVTTAVFKTEGAERWRTLTSYGGNYVAVDPPAGATPTMTFSDIRGNTTELRQYQGADATGAYDSTTYTYTSDDQLATVKNAGNSVWTYTYDLRGRQISASDPDKGTTTSTYDDADRLASSKDARGQSLFYDYDVLDRKTAVHSGSTTGPVLTSWKYDSLGKGLLTSSTRVVDGNSYESAITGYDDLNRPTATQITIPASEGKLAGVYTSSTEFNPDGSVSKVKLPSVPGLPQETVQTIYDPAGNLQAVGGWTSYVVGAQYSSYGEPTRYTMGDVIGHKSTFQGFTYEPGTRRLTSMKVDRESQTTTDDAFNYTYDAAGNITALAHSQMQGASTDRQCFAYDYLRRMTEARTTSNASCATAPTTGTMGSTYPYWRGYEYWKSGNRSKVTDYAAAGNTTTTYAYPVGTAPHPHAVTGVSSSGPAGTSADTYGYDAAGNMSTRTVSGDTDTFAWDAEGRLQSVTGAAGKTDFVYDAEGERLIKHDPTGATLYLGQTEIRLDKAADSVSSTRYYQFNGATVAMRTSSTQVTSLIADPQGTATVSVDVQTDQLVRRWIDPFGVPRGEDANWKSDARGFVDGKLDDSTGLTHLGAREYDPKLGKFISVDPLVDITDPQTLNAYAYSNSNPATFSDPDGTMFLGSKGDEGTESRGTTSVVEQKQTQKKKTGSYWLPYKGYSGKEITNEAEADIESKITAHSETVRVAKERIKRVIKDLVKIVADELGITDALNCFTNGDIGSCVATGVTILASFAGGIAGKILAKYGSPWKWKKGIELVGNLKNLAGKAITAIKDLLKAGKCNSFVPGTKVLLADGTSKPIEQVKVGDKVKATDPATGKTKAEPVVATIIGQGAKHLVNVAVTSGKPGGATTTANLVATDGHPFYLASEHRWVVATELTTGDNLQPSTPGVESHVTAITRYDATARVHNLTIGAIHTYYVLAGATPVLVHNCGGPVHLSDEVIDTHVLPNHGAGTPGEGTKFHEDLDPDDFGSLANEAVSGSPVPSRVDSVTGNHAHDHDFGPGRTISEDGSTRMRVWVDPDRNVRTMHPL